MLNTNPSEECELYTPWVREGARGTIWRTAAGYVADSPSVIVNAVRGPFYSTADAAVRAALFREATIAPELGGVTRKYRIEHPATLPAVYAVDGNDPRAVPDGEPAEDGRHRHTNLMPWERELLRVARTHARMTIVLIDGETATAAAVGGRHVHLTQTKNGVEVGRWRVEDGSRKVALFL